VIVGEVAQAHDGSLGMAHAFIDAIADAGAGAVKFQTHVAAAESTLAEPWRVPVGPQDARRYDYWRRMEFSEDQWAGLRRHADDRGLLFVSSPFSREAVALLRRVGVAFWKLASGELASRDLLDDILSTGWPIAVSTGMNPIDELDRAVQQVLAAGVPLAVLQCTSVYPCPPENVGLNLIPFFQARYGCGVGLSDHSGTIYPGLAAATLGIDLLEVHVTMSREMFGPDVASSVTTTELRQLVDGVRFIERMQASPVDKDAMAGELAAMRSIFTKSIVAVRTLPSGTVLQREHLAAKKPGGGIPAWHLSTLIGRRTRRQFDADEPLAESDLE
jgi:N-acetylneuraminate synthase